ncbi:MAG: hypothetical protein JNK63_02155 [Chthonomonas sp.]|nr:hypothetical protein [Chthonomonas sp.]
MSSTAHQGQRNLGIESYRCAQCGAQLVYQPGSTQLECPYCGHTTPIAPPAATVEEIPLVFSDKSRLNLELEEDRVVHCNSCAAEFSVGADEVTQSCPFCGSNVVVEAEPKHRIMPNGMLPFYFKEAKGREFLMKWLGSRFWAPNNLKQQALKHGRLDGMYLPYWTYDSDTTTQYTGMRGDHYWETESYTDSNGNSRTRQVRRTAWSFAAGTVFVEFDDVLVLATDSVSEKHGQRLTNWDMHELVPYERQYLVGFHTLRYSRDLERCWGTAQQFMQPEIDDAIRYDIGGDEQRITTKNTNYEANTFKHLLLPVFAGSYRYGKKNYNFLVNGRTGEVQGDAPISFWKVFFAVLLGLIIVGTIAYFYYQGEGSSSSRSSGSSFSNELPF